MRIAQENLPWVRGLNENFFGNKRPETCFIWLRAGSMNSIPQVFELIASVTMRNQGLSKAVHSRI